MKTLCPTGSLFSPSMGDEAEAVAIDGELAKVNACLTRLVRIVHPKWKFGQKSLENKKPEEVVTQKTIFEVVVGVKDAVMAITNLLEKTKGKKCPRIAGLEAKVKDLESDLDSQAQKQKRGSLIVTQAPGSTHIQSAEELEKAGTTVAKHACDLIKLKTGVEVEEGDLRVAHHLPNGNIKVKFRDLKMTSKFHSVVYKIKKPLPDEKKIKLYLNFEFTRQRNSLLYEVRRLRREGKIVNYLTDHDGSISVQQGEDRKERVKLTRMSGRGGGKEVRGKQPMRTFTIPELLKRFDPDYVDEEEGELELVEEENRTRNRDSSALDT